MNDMYYLNKDKSVRPCSLVEWSQQLEEMNENGTKHIAEDLINGYRISTVWLGLDHAFLGQKPLLFETMVFKEDSFADIYLDRYTIWDEAVEGHQRAIKWVLDGCKDEVD